MTIQTATVKDIDATTDYPITDATFAAPPAASGGVRGAVNQGSGSGSYLVTWDDTIDVTGVVIISAPGYLNYVQSLLPSWSFTVPLTPSVAGSAKTPDFTNFTVTQDVFPNSFTCVGCRFE